MASVVNVAFGRRNLSALRHGPAGTLAILARVPGEGQDAPQAWTDPTTACHQQQLEATIIDYPS